MGVSLVAVGGYGRGELSARSDLDLLLLHDGRDDKAVAALADRLWYPVWTSASTSTTPSHPARPGDRGRGLRLVSWTPATSPETSA
ncbi:Bifunctional uridylyltransferase/uridylyl-removing enzyme [Streptomyces violaceorubidus]